MKIKALLRGILGVPIGIALGYVIAIAFSFFKGEGGYMPCVPELIERAGNEINAVILQTVLSGLLGAAFAAGSIIWELDDWSIVKQTGVYFLISSIAMMPISYVTYWMEHSVAGFLSYFGIFAAIFAVIWLVEYLVFKNMINKINTKLK
ncbi:MAG: DUF3021 domain-containing protein [Lachnospiraceae bacterium]|jgi:hypothetical protein|nr:DUF3021 domain-containing protein [Lachnospiraceae bacterium]